MKKIILATALVAIAGLSTLMANNNLIRLAGVSPSATSISTHVCGDWDFDFTYQMGGMTVRVTGIIHIRGENGEIAGEMFYTITDENGNTTSWTEPFSIYSGTGTGRFFELYPEVGQQFIADLVRVQ